MTIFEEKAFDGKQVYAIEIIDNITMPKKIEERYNIKIKFQNGDYLFYGKYTHAIAISKLNEIVKLINEHKD